MIPTFVTIGISTLMLTLGLAKCRNTDLERASAGEVSKFLFYLGVLLFGWLILLLGVPFALLVSAGDRPSLDSIQFLVAMLCGLAFFIGVIRSNEDEFSISAKIVMFAIFASYLFVGLVGINLL
jgi:hypothetical protein